jgi:hypothetical protein
MKLGMYIMAPEPIWTAYVINPSHQSVCLCMYPPIVSRQRVGRNDNEYTRNNRNIVGRVVFCAVLVSKEIRLVLHRTSFCCDCIATWIAEYGYVKALHFSIHAKASGWIVHKAEQFLLPRVNTVSPRFDFVVLPLNSCSATCVRGAFKRSLHDWCFCLLGKLL